LKPIVAASWMCALSSLMLGQQQPPPPPPEAPPQQQQNPSATTAPPEIGKDDPDYGEPIGGFFWLTKGKSILLPQAPAPCSIDCIAPTPGQDLTLALPSARPRSPGAFVSIPAGKFNHLEISYFQAYGNGTGYAAVPLSLFGSDFAQGDFISPTYRIRNAQLTWNYLTWPAPPEDSKFRFRTLYSFNYTGVSATVDAPFEASATFVPANGSRNIFYPAFGVSLEYIPSKNFYFEARTWGFGFPHRADIADAEANAVVRVKHFEIFAGYKWFHYKTSPQNAEYFAGSLSGPMAGARWVFR
jgi:hypothetical protein